MSGGFDVVARVQILPNVKKKYATQQPCEPFFFFFRSANLLRDDASMFHIAPLVCRFVERDFLQADLFIRRVVGAVGVRYGAKFVNK